MEQRKATDVLLELEKKLDVALNIIRTQDLNIKILSNKLNSLVDSVNKLSEAPQKITVEAVGSSRAPQPVSQFQQLSALDPEKQILVSSDSRLPQEDSPKGFRRTSRPETFAGDDVYLNPPPSPEVKYPVQMPKAPPGRSTNESAAEVIVPPQPQSKAQSKQQPRPQNVVQNAVPVQQRVVNGSGKSLFLADVEIIDKSTMTSIFKTRTNGTGKWMASLAPGSYRVLIRKMEQMSKQRTETSQDIEVDGTVSPLELQTIIIKS